MTRLKSIAAATLAAFVGYGIFAAASIAPKYHKMSAYLKADVLSEVGRLPSPRKPVSGLRGAAISALEHIKTARDLVLFCVNDYEDRLPEYDIYIDKTGNHMDIFIDRFFVKHFDVGTGQVLKHDKSMFGEYVTPSGDYIVINKMDADMLKDKFGDDARFYGSGLLQLSGPWAPHIAIHGTYDVGKIGRHSSNGCINASNQDLEWMLKNVGIGSRVHVY